MAGTKLTQTGEQVQYLLNNAIQTKLSELENDMGYITEDAVAEALTGKADKGFATTNQSVYIKYGVSDKCAYIVRISFDSRAIEDTILLYQSGLTADGPRLYKLTDSGKAIEVDLMGKMWTSERWCRISCFVVGYKSMRLIPLYDETDIADSLPDGVTYIEGYRVSPLPLYQERLVDGENIKTIDGTAILGEGNLALRDVKYVSQSLSEEEKAQARTNIGASSASDIETINAKIPSAASPSNQLADKAYVNEKIQTETATFKGCYDDWEDILYGGVTADNNDYLVLLDASGYAPLVDGNGSYFIDEVVTDHNTLYKCIAPVNYEETPEAPLPYNDEENLHWEEASSNPKYEGTWRFKYAANGAYNPYNWLPEYQINEEPLTQAQLDALNSGITANKVSKLDALPTNSELETALGGKEDKTNKVNTIVGNESNTTKYASTKAVADAIAKVKASYWDASSDKDFTIRLDESVSTLRLDIFAETSDLPAEKGKAIIILNTTATASEASVIELAGTSLLGYQLVTYNGHKYFYLDRRGGAVVDVNIDVYVTLLSGTLPTVHLYDADVLYDGGATFTDFAAVTRFQETLVSGTNIKTINGSTILGSGNLEINGAFKAEYGTTTYAEVSAAFNAGKVVTIEVEWASGYETLYLTSYNGDTGLFFFSSPVEQDMIRSCYVDDADNWSSIFTFEPQMYALVTALSSSSDNSHYPSAKAVYDELATKASATIETYIPAQASANNQLADKNFVNSSIQTATATFKGNWETWADVPTDYTDYPDETKPDNNDYMVVRDARGYAPAWSATKTYASGDLVCYDDLLYKSLESHQHGNQPDESPSYWEMVDSNPAYEGTWRFKYNGSWDADGKEGWRPEYQVNEKPLTAAQLAALNSGITDTKVAKLDALPATIPTEVFWCTYGTTTYAEITAAISAGKAVMLLYNSNRQFTLAGLHAGSYAFNETSGSTIYTIECSTQSAWTHTGVAWEKTSYKKSSWSSAPNNTNYPSEKLVKDSIDAVADALGKMGVISQVQTWSGTGSQPRTYTIDPDSIVRGIIPQANIDLFESAGAVFNATSGYFELNGLTDISYDEMKEIYGYKGASDMAGQVGNNTLRNLPTCPRTLFPITQNVAGASYINFLRVCTTSYNPSRIESICIGKSSSDLLMGNNMENLIYNCQYLKYVGIQGSLNPTSSASVTNFATSCYNLEEIKITGLAKNIGFNQSSLLSAASVAYMITNAGTATITITLHATAYARANADADVQAALSAHTNVSLASA